MAIHPRVKHGAFWLFHVKTIFRPVKKEMFFRLDSAYFKKTRLII